MLDCQTLITRINNRKGENSHASSNEGKWLDYTIETMRPVNEQYTLKLVQQTNEIEKKLNKAFKKLHINTKTVVIGGLACNTHVSKNDTIDVMLLRENNSDIENTSNNKTKTDEFRKQTIKILKDLYPEALLDDSQPLALEMSTPSKSLRYCLFFGFWQNSKGMASGLNYISNNIFLNNHHSNKLIGINPLEWQFAMDKKDRESNGNQRLLIRVLKNIKADSSDTILLTGYQITSIVHSMDELSLAKPRGQVLFLLLEVSLFLKRIIDNPFVKRGLKTPDDQQLVFCESEESFIEGVKTLKFELENLIKHLVLEIDLYTSISEPLLT